MMTYGPLGKEELSMRRFPIFALLLVAALLVGLPGVAQDVITTAIGGGPNGIPAIDANLYNPCLLYTSDAADE